MPPPFAFRVGPGLLSTIRSSSRLFLHRACYIYDILFDCLNCQPSCFLGPYSRNGPGSSTSSKSGHLPMAYCELLLPFHCFRVLVRPTRSKSGHLPMTYCELSLPFHCLGQLWLREPSPRQPGSPLPAPSDCGHFGHSVCRPGGLSQDTQASWGRRTSRPGQRKLQKSVRSHRSRANSNHRGGTLFASYSKPRASISSGTDVYVRFRHSPKATTSVEGNQSHACVSPEASTTQPAWLPFAVTTRTTHASNQ